jgi:precorrin-6A/cobalt-precorrin-6A reductase
MTLLLLGGTSDARRIAQRLHERDSDVIYSLAGLVRQPQIDCRIVSGGFTPIGGLRQFIETEKVAAILDATHPYAQQMSDTAVTVARHYGIPVWRYQRPPWHAQSADDWHDFDSWQQLVPLLLSRRSVFFSAGQLQQTFVDQLIGQLNHTNQRQALRTAIRPQIKLPQTMIWIEDIGPFDIDAERALFERFEVDTLVTKNSGGDATAAKLTVAREQGLPVFLLSRPPLLAADEEFADSDLCFDFVARRIGEAA